MLIVRFNISDIVIYSSPETFLCSELHPETIFDPTCLSSHLYRDSLQKVKHIAKCLAVGLSAHLIARYIFFYHYC